MAGAAPSIIHGRPREDRLALTSACAKPARAPERRRNRGYLPVQLAAAFLRNAVPALHPCFPFFATSASMISPPVRGRWERQRRWSRALAIRLSVSAYLPPMGDVNLGRS